jgi:GTP-binding protein
MVNFHETHYVISCPDYSYRPKDELKEVVFLGRSNVGKSTLINALVGAKVAFASKKAGKTRYLNYFLVDSRFYLVDAPGYGYTRYGNQEDENFANMMETYFSNPTLQGAILLLDARRIPSEDDETMIRYLKKNHVPTLLVYTKADLAKQQDLAHDRAYALKKGFAEPFFSLEGKGIEELRKEVLHLLD